MRTHMSSGSRILKKPEHHVFVCGSHRLPGCAGACHEKESIELIQHLFIQSQHRGLDRVMVSSTACMNMCDEGPVIVVYPEGKWYRKADVEIADRILTCLEYGDELPEPTLFA